MVTSASVDNGKPNATTFLVTFHEFFSNYGNNISWIWNFLPKNMGILNRKQEVASEHIRIMLARVRRDIQQRKRYSSSDMPIQPSRSRASQIQITFVIQFDTLLNVDSQWEACIPPGHRKTGKSAKRVGFASLAVKGSRKNAPHPVPSAQSGELDFAQGHSIALGKKRAPL